MLSLGVIIVTPAAGTRTEQFFDEELILILLVQLEFGQRGKMHQVILFILQ